MTDEGFSLPKPIAAEMLHKRLFGEKETQSIHNTMAVDGKSLKVQAGEA